jgi:hypothetical protein
MSFAPIPDPEAEIQMWMRHRGTPPFASSPAWEEAQRRLRMGQGGAVNPLQAIIQQLTQIGQQRRQPRLIDFSGNYNFLKGS